MREGRRARSDGFGGGSSAEGEGRQTFGWRARAVEFLVLAASFYVFSRTRADPDLWGHVRFGQLARSLGHVPRKDPYSYLATDWINHEWLSEWIFAALYDFAGTPGLVLLKAVIGLLIAGVLYRALTRGGLPPIRAGWILILAIPLLYIGMDSVRPHLFTFAGFTLLLLAIAGYERAGSRAVLLLPLVFVPWTNLHGGFVAGLGILAVWTAARFATHLATERNLRMALRDGFVPVAVTFGCVLATLLNPYGVDLLAFLARTLSAARPEIVEWRPVDLFQPEGLAYLALLLFTAWSVWRSERPKSVPLLTILVVVSLEPLTAVRFLPLFAIAALVLGATHMASALGRVGPVSTRPAGRPVALVSVGIGTIMLWLSLDYFSCIRVGPPLTGEYPVRAVRLLEDSDVEGNMAVLFDWGEYVIWHTGPSLQVSMDGRRETVYPDSIYLEYQRFLHARGDWDDLMTERPTELVLLPATGYAATNLLDLEPGWSRVYSDSVAVVFGREGTSTARRIARTPVPSVPVDGRGTCFP